MGRGRRLRQQQTGARQAPAAAARHTHWQRLVVQQCEATKCWQRLAHAGRQFLAKPSIDKVANMGFGDPKQVGQGKHLRQRRPKAQKVLATAGGHMHWQRLASQCCEAAEHWQRQAQAGRQELANTGTGEPQQMGQGRRLKQNQPRAETAMAETGRPMH